jgi:hypothetical protein
MRTRLQNHHQGKANKRKGADGETMAAHRLAELGAQCIQQIATPFTMTRAGKFAGRDAFHIAPKAQVAGDLTGIGRDGRMILVEVKATPSSKGGHRLGYARMRKSKKGTPVHDQGLTLDRFALAGATVFLAWARIGLGCRLLHWPDVRRALEFKPGRSITWDQAEAWNVKRSDAADYGLGVY